MTLHVCVRSISSVLPIEMAGRTIYRVEGVEVGAELAPDIFTLQPSTESSRGK